MLRVGCQTVVFEDRKRMLENLEGYLSSPATFEKSFRANAMHTSNEPELINSLFNPPTEQQQAPDSLGQRVQQSANR